MSPFIQIAAGMLLLILLATEEFSRAFSWARAALWRHPGLKPLAYPLAILLGLAGAGIIINACISLVLSLTFSYD
jgi:hypothetical protein